VGQLLVATHFAYLLPEKRKRAYRWLASFHSSVELCTSELNPQHHLLNAVLFNKLCQNFWEEPESK
ncbi:MAG: hypothetical protein Q8L60_17335, partial [Gammaproteobacteria bacterium]|nr:hypothetical protein [Gammaproteobacteria bacterium]